MIVNTITEAKSQLSALIERAERGEEIIINRAGRPVAVLLSYQTHSTRRKPGALAGRIHIADDFDELPDELAEALGAGST